MVVRDDGTRACFSEISGTSGKYLRLHISKHDDIGKTLRVFGTQYGGQPLQEQNSAGDWVMGITITATQLDTTTSILVTKITSIIKEETQGRMWLYSVDPSSGDLEMLGQYEHDETNPAYRCSVIQNFGNVPYFTDANGRRMRSVEALFKAEWIPVREDTDFSLLDNEDAIKLGFQAWRLEEANDDAGAEIKWAKAIRELNFSIRDREPSMSTTIRVNSISSNYPICNPC